MMGRTRDGRSVFGIMTGLNLAIAIMFAMVLFPKPVAPPYEPVAAIRKQPAVTEAPRKITIGTPIRVVVTSVGIDVPVRTGSYDIQSNTWTLDSASAFHADRSVPVNDLNGTTLIYGHAEWGMFGVLPDIGPGSTAAVYTQEGPVFNYEFQSNQQVDPTDTSVLTTHGPPTLVLQTCSGAFDAYRTLVTFQLMGVSEV